MATHALEMDRKKAVLRKPRGAVLWLAFYAMLAFYSLLVWDSGSRQLPGHASPELARQLDSVEARSNKGVPYRDVAKDALQAYPLWNNLTAMVTGTRFGFGTNGNTEPLRYYHTMSDTQKSVLSVHMILGGLLLILGMFQFTPMFRLKHRRAHRAIGSVYIVCCFAMTTAAMVHLVHAGVANTYQGFAFNFQLWFLATSTVIAQVLAIFFIRRRNYPLHLGFQIYTFGAFLNAPIQRLDWAVFGAIYPHLTQGEVNNLVNILTFWQCLLIGYAFFSWNRAACPVRRDPVEVPPQSVVFKVAIAMAAFAAVATSLLTYAGGSGLGSWSAARAIVPATTLAAEAMVHAAHPLLTATFAIAIATAILSGVWLMVGDETSRTARRLFYGSAVAAGIQQIAWGYQLGEPSMAVTAGGGFYFVSGVSLSGFALLALFFEKRQKERMWHEMMVFAVNFAFAPSLVPWNHVLWDALDMIPAYYLARGHGYILAAGGAILLPTFIGYVSTMTNRETRSRIIV